MSTRHRIEKNRRIFNLAVICVLGVIFVAIADPLPWPVQNVNSVDPTGDVVYVNAGATVTNEGHYHCGTDSIQIQAVSILNTKVLHATIVQDGGTTNVILTGLQAGVSAVKLSGLYFDWSVENPDHTWGAWVTNSISYGVLVRSAGGVAPGLPTGYTPLGSRAIMGEPNIEQWYQDGTNGTVDGRRTDVIDIYLQGGPCSWVYQNSDWDANWYPGKYLYKFIRGCKRQGRIPCIVFYCIPPAGVGDSALGALKSVNESTDIKASDINRFGSDPSNPWKTEMVAVTNYMIPYYHRTIRVMRECLQKTTGDGWPCLVVIEPDFIGYMSANLGDDPADPNATNIVYDSNNYTFKVSRAFEQGPGETNTVGTNIYTYSTDALLDAGEQAQFPDTLKGFVTSISYIFRKEFILDETNVQLGANIMIGWKLNIWASKSGTGYSGNVLKPTGTPFGVGKGIIRWTDAEGQGTTPNSFSNIVEWLKEEAAGITGYYVSAGITNNTDYLFIDRYGIDAASAGYVTDPASSTWFWNHDHWNNYLAFVESVQQEAQLPIILWQLPMGHINTTDAKKSDSITAYTPLSNTADSGSFEDSSATFWFGDTFAPGGTDRMAYFSTNRWGTYDTDRAGDVTVAESKITWRPAINRLRALNVAALLSGPGVGRGSSTFACAVDTTSSADDFWWINQAQRYYLCLETLGDYDGDGLTDLAVYDEATGCWYIKSENGTVILWQTPWGGQGFTSVQGDYDGDGIADMAVYYAGYWYIRTVAGALILWAEQWGGPDFTPVTGDYNGDGSSDLTVYHEGTGYWYSRTVPGTLLLWQALLGGPGFTPVPGDYDGDSRSDVGVYCDGYWYIKTVDEMELVRGTMPWGDTFGGPDFTPVAADYDGDGKTDLAVYHEQSGTWFITTLAGAVLVWGEQWGGPGFTPVPGDYNGDSISDLAVYYQGYWFVETVDGTLIMYAENWGARGYEPIGK